MIMQRTKSETCHSTIWCNWRRNEEKRWTFFGRTSKNFVSMLLHHSLYASHKFSMERVIAFSIERVLVRNALQLHRNFGVPLASPQCSISRSICVPVTRSLLGYFCLVLYAALSPSFVWNWLFFLQQSQVFQILMGNLICHVQTVESSPMRETSSCSFSQIPCACWNLKAYLTWKLYSAKHDSHPNLAINRSKADNTLSSVYNGFAYCCQGETLQKLYPNARRSCLIV